MNRRIVATLTLLSALVLGCGSDDDGDGEGTAGGDSSTTGTSAADSGSGNSGGSSSTSSAASTGGAGGDTTSNSSIGGAAGSGSDEPYANVVEVVASETSGGFTFNVSIESSDVGCTQYTDWWEVLSEDGELLYRRILTHSHTNENGTTDDTSTPDNTFTRSGGPVEIASDETVIVRAHNSVVGYNGRVMRGSAASGFSDAPDIGPDFAADVEDDDPQVESCAF